MAEADNDEELIVGSDDNGGEASDERDIYGVETQEDESSSGQGDIGNINALTGDVYKKNAFRVSTNLLISSHIILTFCSSCLTTIPSLHRLYIIGD